MSDPITTYLDQHLDDYIADMRHLSGIDSGTDDKAGVDTVQDWFQQRLTSWVVRGNRGRELPRDDTGVTWKAVLTANRSQSAGQTKAVNRPLRRVDGMHGRHVGAGRALASADQGAGRRTEIDTGSCAHRSVSRPHEAIALVSAHPR